METSPSLSWINVCGFVLFAVVCGSSRADYDIHPDSLKFDEALEECSSGGYLTTISTMQEKADILNTISKMLAGSSETQFNFWVGLRKNSSDCVVLEVPLKGFRWTVDGSDTSEVGRWNTQPELTCTGVRCATLSGEVGPPITWGLTPRSCRDIFPFICKRPGTATEPPVKIHTTPKPQPDAPPTQAETTQPEPAPDAGPQPTPEPATDSESRPLPVPKPALDNGPCHYPTIEGARSYKKDPADDRRLMVECWSGDNIWITCPKMTNKWEGNSSSIDHICQKCNDGYQEDGSGNCVDIDECSNTPCKQNCLNTEGSYRCVCYDRQGNPHNEGSDECMKAGDALGNPTGKPDLPPDGPPGPTDESKVVIDDPSQSGILIPVLIAVMCLVVLVVVVVAVVKCCLMRRSKKRAMKKAEKMALRGQETGRKDSMETANEKEAT